MQESKNPTVHCALYKFSTPLRRDTSSKRLLYFAITGVRYVRHGRKFAANYRPRFAANLLDRALRRPLCLRLLLAADVEDVHPLAEMHPAHVGPDVRRVPGAVRAIRAIEPRQLSALELEVIVQIVLTREHVAALVARVTPALLVSRGVVGVTVPLWVTRMHYLLVMHTCEQKREREMTTNDACRRATAASRSCGLLFRSSPCSSRRNTDIDTGTGSYRETHTHRH